MYTPAFFDELTHGTRESARIIVLPRSTTCSRPDSVLDVGCGTATWLYWRWGRAGIERRGRHGRRLRRPDRPAIARGQVRSLPTWGSRSHSGASLTLFSPLRLPSTLMKFCADTFVESLARHGDTILFSAAVPGQGGTHHVNEQWPSYWAEKFAKAGYGVYDVIRPQYGPTRTSPGGTGRTSCSSPAGAPSRARCPALTWCTRRCGGTRRSSCAACPRPWRSCCWASSGSRALRLRAVFSPCRMRRTG